LSPNNSFLHPLGLGAYHSGIEIFGKEWSFGQMESGGVGFGSSDALSVSGVFDIPPRAAHNQQCIFRESVLMGETELSINEVEDVIDKMKANYPAYNYHFLFRNCNTFSNELCKALVGRSVPSYVNRLSKLGSCCTCLLPPRFQANINAPTAPSTTATTTNAPKFVPFSGSGQSLIANTSTNNGNHHNKSNNNNKNNNSNNTKTKSKTTNNTTLKSNDEHEREEKRERARLAAMARLAKEKERGQEREHERTNKVTPNNESENTPLVVSHNLSNI